VPGRCCYTQHLAGYHADNRMGKCKMVIGLIMVPRLNYGGALSSWQAMTVRLFKMKYTTLAALLAFTASTAVTAHAANDPAFNNEAAVRQTAFAKSNVATENSAASLNALLTEWDQASFEPPGKPGQSRVYGRDGYVTTGGGYNEMVSLIRSAVADVQAGRDQDAAPTIAKARTLLAADNLRSTFSDRS
jgi:hypothetical protein